MARHVSAETRQDLLQAIRERYRVSTKDEKVRILDEFMAVGLPPQARHPVVQDRGGD